MVVTDNRVREGHCRIHSVSASLPYRDAAGQTLTRLVVRTTNGLAAGGSDGWWRVPEQAWSPRGSRGRPGAILVACAEEAQAVLMPGLGAGKAKPPIALPYIDTVASGSTACAMAFWVHWRTPGHGGVARLGG